MLGGEVMVVIAVLLGVASVAVVLWLRTAPTNQATASCRCGRVKLEVTVVPSSRLIAQPALFCSCRDCVDFARYVAERSSDAVSFIDIASDSVSMVQFFRSDVRMVAGAEAIRVCKLECDTPLYRYYAGCCNTPLGLNPPLVSVPLISVYRRLFAEADRKLFPEPTVQLFAPSAKQGSVPISGVVQRDGMFDVPFLARFIGRLFVGLALGKGKPDPFRQGGIDYGKIDHGKTAVHIVRGPADSHTD